MQNYDEISYKHLPTYTPLPKEENKSKKVESCKSSVDMNFTI